ncbi:class III signal peptide-containing protein [Methanocaldococcus infernus]|uniref:Flagellin n=1 Tax=Methanocaldococcus infernus (strain DSM 11812 / JCM 15783 / ME) TaxID=573063 RepID=D5VR08_METIM|nr:class III signal peptide-containing protein [Methanocaldococcus infernus]ADG13011.1 Protein of unknown function DUF361 [Methanocaldococcus infernus ME]
MRGQISLEFSILILAVIVFVIISVGYVGIYGLNRSVQISAMSLAHSSVAKMKENIELVSLGDINTTKIVYIKTPPGTWSSNNNIIVFTNNNLNYSVSATCSVNVEMNGNLTINQGRTIRAVIRKINDNLVRVTIS